MTDSTQMKYNLDDLAYELPEELIAQKPLDIRHQSRLMKLDRNSGKISHQLFCDLPSLLLPGDLLVINDTRVIPSRIFARRQSGGLISISLLHARAGKANIWEAMASPIRRLKEGEKLELLRADGVKTMIEILQLFHDKDGYKRLLVNLGKAENVYELLESAGRAPLPPYIKRQSPEEENEQTDQEEPNNRIYSEQALDLERYQTIYAREAGAVAAPTAGLHFSEPLFAALDDKGIETASLTLHVGPGTFKPITTSIEDHTVEAERYSIPETTALAINKAKSENRRVIAIGTTSLRALESAGATGSIEPIADESTSLYIRPGYNFKIVDGLITNFHLSGSSLLVLVAAFAGAQEIMKAYREAVKLEYRFYSYGDAMLII